MCRAQIRQYYPNKYVQVTPHILTLWMHVIIFLLFPDSVQPTDFKRIFILYTLYNLPEVYLLSSLVDFFEHSPDYKR